MKSILATRFVRPVAQAYLPRNIQKFRAKFYCLSAAKQESASPSRLSKRQNFQDYRQLSRRFPLTTDIFFPGQISSVFRDLENELARLWGTEATGQNGVRNVLGQVDIMDNKEAFIFKMDVPGLTKNDLTIRVTPDNMLMISGERTKEEENKDDSAFHRIERTYGKFSRSFQLPEKNVDTQAISAKVENGELILNVPKKEAEPQPEFHQIEIS